MALPAVLYHYFQTPLPYARTLALQERLHQLQLEYRRSSSHNDVLLLLQHRPVFTAGRRQQEGAINDDRTRLTRIGADFVTTQRGGEFTYHGPGQIVGYPLLDLGRSSPPMGVREYICRLQKTLEAHLTDRHGLRIVASEHTGVFLDQHTKIASIGIQVRHRLTTHGFAMNVTKEPIPWFDQVVACGLQDVRAGSIESSSGQAVTVADEIPALVETFGRQFGRDIVKMDVKAEGEIGAAISSLEEEARAEGDWLTAPKV